MSNVSMRQLLEAGVHFGHRTRYWNPKMAPYIFGDRSKIHIINLEDTLSLYNDAMNFIGSLASRKASIMFVGTKRAAQEAIKTEAERCGMPYVNHRWLGGMLTNFKTVRRSINRLKELDEKLAGENTDGFNKKELLTLSREQEKLERSLGGIKQSGRVPDALFVVDVGNEKIAVNEARKLGIPVIGVVDTNNSPEGIDYIIPGNDDAIRAIQLYVSGVADAIIQGQAAAVNVGNEGDEFVEVSDEVKSEKKAVRKKAKPAVAKKAATDAKEAVAVEVAPEVPVEVAPEVPKEESVIDSGVAAEDKKAG